MHAADQFPNERSCYLEPLTPTFVVALFSAPCSPPREPLAICDSWAVVFCRYVVVVVVVAHALFAEKSLAVHTR